MLTPIIRHMTKVLWDEDLTFKGKSYVWHFQMWEAYVLGTAACAVIYALMMGVCLISLVMTGTTI